MTTHREWCARVIWSLPVLLLIPAITGAQENSDDKEPSKNIIIEQLETLKKDGARTDVDPATAIDVPTAVTQLAPTFSDVRAKALVAANLEVGDALEYQFRRIIRVPLKANEFWALHYRERSAVVESERVILDVPEGALSSTSCRHPTRSFMAPAAKTPNQIGRTLTRCI